MNLTKYQLVLLSLLFLFSCSITNLSPNEGEHFEIYETTNDFLKQTTNGKKYYARIKSSKEDYVYLSRVFDLETLKPIKNIWIPWAIKFKDINYVNMIFAEEYVNPNLYVKFDIVGKVSVFFIDSKTYNKIKSNGVHYGGGLQGVLMKKSRMGGKKWKNQKG